MEVYWQQENLFFNAVDYFKALLVDIENAKHHIILETYIFKNDDIGIQVVHALCQAAQRGVCIQVLMDGIGSYEHASIITEYLTQAGIEVRLFSPLPWSATTYQHALNNEKWYVKWINFFGRINKRSHRKLCIIDNEVAWVGSFNIASYEEAPNHAWKELAARVTGDHVEQLQQDFNEIWHREDNRHRYYHFRYFLSNRTISMRSHKNARLIQFIHEANTRIWITNAYFSPSYAFLRALKMAANRGVSIKIIVPQKSDVIFFPSLASTYYADLLKSGIHIYEYRDKILHEKSMLIDVVAIIGSTNLNYRSFFHDLELDLLLTQVTTIHSMETKFLIDIEHSQEITADRFQHYPKLLLAMGWCSRFLRYWL